MSSPIIKFVKDRSYSVGAIGEGFAVFCPDCSGTLFKNESWVGCHCYGDLKGKGLTLKKSATGIKASFSDDWDEDSISMLLTVLREKNI